MNYLDFKENMFEISCFNVNQIYVKYPNFDRNNLTRWVKKGRLVRLRRGYYSFPEFKKHTGFSYFIANRIYQPSYISLYTALAFYGLIPEAVVQITSVTSLKTATFVNEFGEFSYKTVKNDLMFGYDLKTESNDITIKFAKPEKALLDLLYLYPFYDNIEAMIDLRLDADVLHNELDLKLMNRFSIRYKNKAFEKRVKILQKAYDL